MKLTPNLPCLPSCRLSTHSCSTTSLQGAFQDILGFVFACFWHDLHPTSRSCLILHSNTKVKVGRDVKTLRSKPRKHQLFWVIYPELKVQYFHLSTKAYIKELPSQKKHRERMYILNFDSEQKNEETGGWVVLQIFSFS